MKAALLIALAGCCGALCRWGFVSWIDRFRGTSHSFPLGIFAVNILGCLIFGYLVGLGENRNWMSEHIRHLVFTGFLGSFTTFSTFSWNTLELLKSDQFGMAMLNIGLSVVIGIAGVWGGYSLATMTR